MSTGLVVSVPTPEGEGRLHATLPVDAPLEALLVLGHGAGGGIEAVDLSALAHRLPGRGIGVIRFEQPWRVAGKKVAVRPPKLDVAWLAAMEQLLDAPGPGGVVMPDDVPVFVGGRSAGARVACRTSALPALADRVAGVVACAFPLHLPGRPEASRQAELLAPDQPVLVLQGERDTFGGYDEVFAMLSAARADNVHLVRVPGGDHSMRVPAGAAFRPADVRDLIVEATLAFCREVAG